MALFGLSEAHYNIVKQAARKCSTEIKTAINGGKKYDHVAASVIDMHHDGIKTLVTRLQFVYIIGHLNNRFGNSEQGYE